MAKPRRWFHWTALVPLIATAFFVLVWDAAGGERNRMPNSQVKTLLFLPVKPVEWAFAPLYHDMEWHYMVARSFEGIFEIYWIFGALCYCLSATLYQNLWRLIRGDRSPWMYGVFGFLILLFLLNSSILGLWCHGTWTGWLYSQ